MAQRKTMSSSSRDGRRRFKIADCGETSNKEYPMITPGYRVNVGPAKSRCVIFNLKIEFGFNFVFTAFLSLVRRHNISNEISPGGNPRTVVIPTPAVHCLLLRPPCPARKHGDPTYVDLCHLASAAQTGTLQLLTLLRPHAHFFSCCLQK